MHKWEKDLEWATNIVKHQLWLGGQHVHDMLRLRFSTESKGQDPDYSKDDHIRDLQDRNTRLVEEVRALQASESNLRKILYQIKSLVTPMQ